MSAKKMSQHAKFLSKFSDEERKKYQRDRKRKYREGKRLEKEKTEPKKIKKIYKYNEDLLALIHKYSKDAVIDVSPHTLSTRITLLRGLYREMYNKEFLFNKVDWLKDTKKVEEAVKSKKSWKSKNTIIAIYVSIAFLLRYVPSMDKTYKYYSQLATGMEINRVDEKKDNIGAGKTIANWDKIKSFEPTDILSNLLYYLYIEQIPRRAQDYARLVIDDGSDIPSYFNTLVLNEFGEPCTLIIRKYKKKASDKYGPIEIDISVDLSLAISLYMIENKRKSGDLLFFGKIKEDSVKYRVGLDNTFSTMVNKSLGYSINELRHSYASYIIPNITSENIGDEIAKQMGTSLTTLREQYIYDYLKLKNKRYINKFLKNVLDNMDIKYNKSSLIK